MTATTQTVRDQGVMVVECDIPAELTIAEYRASRRHEATRWEKTRVGLLGAGVVGIVAETLLAHRSSR